MGALVKVNDRRLCKTVDRPRYPEDEVFRHIVRGGVMSPTLPEGSVCLVDASDRQIEAGNLYCLKYPVEGNVIRRLFREGKEIVIKCDNPLAPAFRIDDAKIQSHVVGRVKASLSLFL